MPAKTVVFTNVRKFDGSKFRWITSGEYIQMSGRTGRRGIDDRGICILMVDEKMEPSTAKMMLRESADSLNSAFHLSYNMLLSQMRCEDGDPKKLLRHSFYQFQTDRALPDLEKQSKELKAERDSIVLEEEESLKSYYDLLQQYHSWKKDVRDIIFSPKYCLPFLQLGRLLRLRCNCDDNIPYFSTEDQVTWGVIINFEKVKNLAKDAANRRPEDLDYTVDVLTRCVVNKEVGLKNSVKIVPLNGHGEAVVVSLPLSQLDSLSSIRLVIPKDLLPLDAQENTLKKISEVRSRFAKDGVPLLDPVEDMKIQVNAYKQAVRKIEKLESLFDRHEIRKSPLIQQKLKVLHDKQELTSKIKSTKNATKSSTALAFKDELSARKRVLRRLGIVLEQMVFNKCMVELQRNHHHFKGNPPIQTRFSENLQIDRVGANGASDKSPPSRAQSSNTCTLQRKSTNPKSTKMSSVDGTSEQKCEILDWRRNIIAIGRVHNDSNQMTSHGIPFNKEEEVVLMMLGSEDL